MKNVKNIEDAKIKEEFVTQNNVEVEIFEYDTGKPNTATFLDIKGYQATAFADVAVFIVQTKDEQQFIYKMSDINRIRTYITKEAI